MEKNQLIQEMKARIAAFTDADFGTDGATDITEIFCDPKRDYPIPDFKPSDKPHPRVLVTREMIPGIRAAFENPECAAAVAEYKRLLALNTDGTLPEPYMHERGRMGEHNHDYQVLAAIEARALEYLLTGDEYYGYSAVLGILNFVSSLRINWIHSDQCREYGMTMYYIALVYDWCYDLMSDDDRRRLRIGAEHRLCRGKSGTPEKATAGGVKLEVGFPPFGQGCVSGHGTEMQLLRDFLSFSIAIYDEQPGWWNYVESRLENEYVPVREVFYASGIYPQGMSCYAPYRFVGDLWSACITKALTGKNAFPDADMKRVVRSFLANETVNGGMFTSGDGTGMRLFNVVGYCALLSAYLFDDETARAAAVYLKHGVSEFSYGYVSISPSFSLIAARNGIKTALDRHEGIDLIHKNRGYINQYISRDSWEDDSTVVLMKAGGRNTSNHEHCDAGHFQIYHKGYLTSHAGVYRGYGSDNHYYYHIASIGHNVPRVYNPAHRDTELKYDEQGRITNKAAYWYSGGQTRIWESSNLDTWHKEDYIFGETPVMQSAYENGKPAYAYISTEITRAYPSDTVAYLRRTMLTSYKTNGEAPMALFIFDRIESVEASFKKTFTLQLIGKDAPEISDGCISATNSDGRLTLTAVTDSNIEAIGGAGRNYLINGIQCECPGAPTETWGRIEVSPVGERITDHMLNVITVGDKDAAPVKALALACSKACFGAYAAGSAAIFRAYREDIGSDIEFTLPAPAYTYFSGLNEGEFAVLDKDGRTVATVAVAEDKNMGAVNLPEGSYTLKKIK